MIRFTEDTRDMTMIGNEGCERIQGCQRPASEGGAYCSTPVIYSCPHARAPYSVQSAASLSPAPKPPPLKCHCQGRKHKAVFLVELFDAIKAVSLRERHEEIIFVGVNYRGKMI